MLYSPCTLGRLHLKNRVVMAPMTRLRADLDGTPNNLMRDYYAQRAGAGLIITEGTWPVAEGRTWARQPGIENDSHVEGWRRVTEAVHERGGTIIMQIMHGGRISHPDFTGTGRIIAPSALAAPGSIRRLNKSKANYPVPQSLTTAEIPEIIGQFTMAARNAMAAGMDGVQIHGANGYLVHQFFAPNTNDRSDIYGGGPEHRARFAIELCQAVAQAIGPDNVGIRLSPQHNIQGIAEDDEENVAETYGAFAEGISDIGLGHIEVLYPEPQKDFVQKIREVSGTPFIINTGFQVPSTREDAENYVNSQLADAYSVGRLFISNPDLPVRWAKKSAITVADTSTFYVGGPNGYIDYPLE